jgi:hypothetical protein
MSTKGVTVGAGIALLFVLLTRCHLGDRIEEDEMSEACGTHRKDGRRKKDFSRKTRRYETTLKTKA